MCPKGPNARRLSHSDKACCVQSVETAAVVAQLTYEHLFQQIL